MFARDKPGFSRRMSWTSALAFSKRPVIPHAAAQVIIVKRQNNGMYLVVKGNTVTYGQSR